MSPINKGLTAARVLQRALERPQVLAGLPAESLVQTQRLMRALRAVQVNAATADENACFRRMRTEQAGGHAFEAFLQQRKASFS